MDRYLVAVVIAGWLGFHVQPAPVRRYAAAVASAALQDAGSVVDFQVDVADAKLRLVLIQPGGAVVAPLCAARWAEPK